MEREEGDDDSENVATNRDSFGTRHSGSSNRRKQFPPPPPAEKIPRFNVRPNSHKQAKTTTSTTTTSTTTERTPRKDVVIGITNHCMNCLCEVCIVGVSNIFRPPVSHLGWNAEIWFLFRGSIRHFERGKDNEEYEVCVLLWSWSALCFFSFSDRSLNSF